jgi:hypothetical protein
VHRALQIQDRNHREQWHALEKGAAQMDLHHRDQLEA